MGAVEMTVAGVEGCKNGVVGLVALCNHVQSQSELRHTHSVVEGEIGLFAMVFEPFESCLSVHIEKI